MLIILIDEDLEDINFFFKGLLEYDPEIEFVCVQNNEAAIGILNELPELPDFVFLETNISDRKAMDFFEKRNADHKFNSIPVIVYSATRYMADIKESKHLGAAYFMTKPTNTEDLLLSFRHIFSKQKSTTMKDTLITLNR